LLIGVKGETFPLSPVTLECSAADTLTPNAFGLDCLPGELGGGLVGDGGPVILLAVDVIEGDGILEEERLQLDLHEEAPLVVVRPREHRPPAPDLAVDLHGRQTPTPLATPWRRW